MSIHPFFGIQPSPTASFVAQTMMPDLDTVLTIVDRHPDLTVENLEQAEDHFVRRMLGNAENLDGSDLAKAILAARAEIRTTSKRDPGNKLVIAEDDWPAVLARLVEPESGLSYQDDEFIHYVGRSALRGTILRGHVRVYTTECLPAGRMLMLFQHGQMDGPAVFTNEDRYELTYIPGNKIRPEDYVRVITL